MVTITGTSFTKGVRWNDVPSSTEEEYLQLKYESIDGEEVRWLKAYEEDDLYWNLYR